MKIYLENVNEVNKVEDLVNVNYSDIDLLACSGNLKLSCKCTWQIIDFLKTEGLPPASK